MYIGQTRQKLSQRIRQHKSSKCVIGKAIQTHGFKNFSVDIIVDGDFNDALIDELERHYINIYGSMHRTKGYNRESGGNSNKRLSEEVKSKISKSQGGKKATEETRRRMSGSHKQYRKLHPERAKVDSERMKGNKYSLGVVWDREVVERRGNSLKECWDNFTKDQKEERLAPLRKGWNEKIDRDLLRKRMQELRKKFSGWNSPINIPVLQLTLDKIPIKLWYGAEETSLYDYGASGVRDVCMGKNKRKTHKGYLWKYATEEEILKYDHLKEAEPIKVEKVKQNKTVIQKDLEGNVLKEWYNSRRISDHYKIKPQRISAIIKHHRIFDNSTFEFKEIEDKNKQK